MIDDFKKDPNLLNGKGEKDEWITVENGEHVLIEDGQTKEEAINEHFDQKQDKIAKKEKDYSKSFAEQIDNVLTGKHNPNYDLIVSDTPKPLIDIGFDQTPLLMRNSKIKDILSKHNEMTVEIIKQIPDAIKNPLLILKSKTNPDESVVMITDMVTSKGEIIIPIWKEQDGIYLDIELNKTVNNKTNFIASAYGRDIKGLLEYAINENGFLYFGEQEKKVNDLFTLRGLQLPTRPNNTNLSINSIPKFIKKST